MNSSAMNNGSEVQLLGAIAEPNRFRIIELLRAGPLPVGQISEQLDLQQPQTSKHLRVLADAGIVHFAADRNRRIYALRPDPFRTLDDWIQSFSRTMTQRYDNLDIYLHELQATPEQEKENDN